MQDYAKDGFFTADTDLAPMIAEIHAAFISVFDHIARGRGLAAVRTVADVIALYRGPNRALWVAAWRVLNQLPEVGGLGNQAAVKDAIRRAGIRLPALGHLQVRADMPNDPEYGVFKAHQDFSYNVGSTNSVTIWIPFQDVDHATGCLRIVPGSHLSGLFAHENGILERAPEIDFVDVPMRRGQILAFSQFLVHKSGKNVSGDIRFSLQIRVNDLADATYIARDYYLNHENRMRGNASVAEVDEILASERARNVDHRFAAHQPQKVSTIQVQPSDRLDLTKTK